MRANALRMSRKLKINILLYHPGLSGGDRVMAFYARYLRAHGHEVFLTGLKPPRIRLRKKVMDFLRTRKLPGRGHRKTHYDNAGLEVQLAKNKSQITDSDLPDADIVIATYWPTAEWAVGLSPQKGAPVYFIQNDESQFPHADPERVNATYRSPIKKIVISKWLETLLREKFNQTPLANIANSVDMQQFNAMPRAKNKIPCVGFLYGDSPIKGVDITLEAIKRIRKSIPDLKVIAFGSGPISKHLPLPAGCAFHLNPPQDKIRDLYAQCDVWISGSRVEGFNLPPLEAMACRTPVVATVAGALPELVQNGVQGYVVPIEDADALAEKALNILKGSDAEWRRMSDAAYATATSYSWDDAGALFEAALLEAANEAQSGAT